MRNYFREYIFFIIKNMLHTKIDNWKSQTRHILWFVISIYIANFYLRVDLLIASLLMIIVFMLLEFFWLSFLFLLKK